MFGFGRRRDRSPRDRSPRDRARRRDRYRAERTRMDYPRRDRSSIDLAYRDRPRRRSREIVPYRVPAPGVNPATVHRVNPGAARGATPGPPILGSQYVAGLPLVRASELPNDRQECGTCLEDYKDEADDVPVVRLPCCKSTVHRECALEWLGEDKAKNNSCPFCRQRLFTRLNYNGQDLPPEAVLDGLAVDDEGVDNFRMNDMRMDDLRMDNLRMQNLRMDGVGMDDLDFGDSDPELSDYDMPTRDNRYDRLPRGAAGYQPPRAAVPDTSVNDRAIDHRRLQDANVRRQGALQDCLVYRELLQAGAPLGNLRPNAHVLNFFQDRAMFDELRRRGAFAQPGMDEQYRTEAVQSDVEIYEDLRDKDIRWDVRTGGWHHPDGRDVRFGAGVE